MQNILTCAESAVFILWEHWNNSLIHSLKTRHDQVRLVYLFMNVAFSKTYWVGFSYNLHESLLHFSNKEYYLWFLIFCVFWWCYGSNPGITNVDMHSITEPLSKSLAIISYKKFLEFIYKILNGQINIFDNLNFQLDLVKNKTVMLMTLLRYVKQLF